MRKWTNLTLTSILLTLLLGTWTTAALAFGVTYNVGNRVWLDTNGDKVQDANEIGIDGLAVHLEGIQSNGQAVTLSTTTGPAINIPSTTPAGDIVDGHGWYNFTVEAGTYTITVSGIDSALVQTYDLDGLATPNNATFSLNANRYDVDFGYVPAPTTGFCTFTQGGWGAKPSGNNPGALLWANWASVYPTQTLVIGATYTLRFDAAAEVTAFLPAGGTAGPLQSSYDPPTHKTEAGVLAGQVLALRLNVDFSNAGVTQPGLGACTIQSGPFAGQSVAAFLAIAENVLGGGTGYNLSALNDTATQINECFDNGSTNTGFVK